jgi:phospholipid/cholesterol/gamma-HCH transport system substrate-binding protein
MLKYRGRNLIRAGFIGAIFTVLVIMVGLQPQQLGLWATSVGYQAQFDEAGGIAAGDDVSVSGIKVGSVSGVSLHDGFVWVTFFLDGKVQLGSQTSAHIKTESLLGKRVLRLDSAGSGTMRASEVIPVSRTSSPYSLTEAVSDVTTNTAGTDTQAINQSLDTLSDTLDRVAPQLGPAFEGLTRVSQTLNARDQTLGHMFQSASALANVLSERSQQVNTLILNGNDLFGVLVDRRNAIADLLAQTSVVAQQLTGLVHDNEKELAPTLEKLNSVTAMLEQNRDNIAKALPGLVKFTRAGGESVAQGYYYNGYIPNVSYGQLLQPFFDYLLGFRRGVNAGQPPDNAGPRAEFPWPHNGIPGGSR